MHNADRQRASFDKLVDAGVYSTHSTHSDKAKHFFATTLAGTVLHPGASGRAITGIDCGCGPGAWSEFLLELCEAAGVTLDLKGFDLSGGMVELARQRLAGRVAGDAIVVGDLLDADTYRRLAPEPVDLLLAYDAVQQLPPKRQRESVELMLGRLAVGGTLIVFDHEKHSPYGRTMARRKFITKYLRIPLVPRYYCNARYPPLDAFATDIDRRDGFSARVLSTPEFPKRALVAERTT